MRFHREAKRRRQITDDDEGGDAAHRRLRATVGKRSAPQDVCGSEAAAEMS